MNGRIMTAYHLCGRESWRGLPFEAGEQRGTGRLGEAPPPSR
jgi:hypothetical protein